MAPNLRLLKSALNNAARGANAATMQDLADRDFEEIWNTVKALAKYGDSEHVRLQASELMLAYMMGRPTERAEIKTTSAPAAPFDTSQLTGEELRAYRVLAQARERLLNGGSVEPEVIDAPALPPLPPLK